LVNRPRFCGTENLLKLKAGQIPAREQHAAFGFDLWVHLQLVLESCSFRLCGRSPAILPPEPALIAKLFKRFLINAAKKQNRLQMSQVFSVSAHLWLDDFAFQGFYRAGPGT
jgi:hypothetical protein